MFTDGHETKVKENLLNENFAKAEFQALWKQINHRYAYTVSFDSKELIRKAIDRINEKLFVSELQYTTTISRQKAEMNMKWAVVHLSQAKRPEPRPYNTPRPVRLSMTLSAKWH